MVPKGLCVGDVFSEGAQQYVVLEVLPDGNYISKASEKAAASTAEEKPVKTPARKAVKEDGNDKL